MSALVVSFTQLSCDNCGALYEPVERGVTTARLLAARDGWKFAEFRQPRSGPRVWDACPLEECRLPESGEEAIRMRSELDLRQPQTALARSRRGA